MHLAGPFIAEEENRIKVLALEAIKKRTEEQQARRIGGSASIAAGGDPTKADQAVQQLRRSIANNVFNKVLSLLPRELSAAIQGAALLGGIVPGIGTAAGAIAGPVLVQVQRVIDKNEKAREARLQALGPTAGEAFVGEFNLKKIIKESASDLLRVTKSTIKLEAVIAAKIATKFVTGETGKLAEALFDIKIEQAKKEFTESAANLLEQGEAGARAVRTYSDIIADDGMQAHAYAMTVAEAEFNKRAGKIPMRIRDAYSVIFERANAEVESFRKDPPLKG